MSDPTGHAAVYLLPGMSAKFYISGFLAANSRRKISLDGGGTREIEGTEMTRGYYVLNEDVGTIRESEEEEVSVIYTHNKFSMNKIYFFAHTGEKAVIDIISVPIHDHSSIVTGGPAYGTYFTDDETVDSSG